MQIRCNTKHGLINNQRDPAMKKTRGMLKSVLMGMIAAAVCCMMIFIIVSVNIFERAELGLFGYKAIVAS